MQRLNAKQLRSTEPGTEDIRQIERNPVTIILDNVLDTYNVGAIFRLADAIAAERIILCGETLTPPNHRIKKASVDTWKWVPWQYEETARQAITRVRMENTRCQIVAVEQDPRSVPFQQVAYGFPVAIVVGHESYGISKEVLDMADTIVELPMWGINTSLNVMVSCGLVLYEIMRKSIDR